MSALSTEMLNHRPESLTFSWRRCFKSLSSRYVLLLRTGVEKGFMIFLMATDVPESWSLAELMMSAHVLFLH